MRLYTRPGSPFWQAEFTLENGHKRRITTDVPHHPRLKARAEQAAREKQAQLSRSTGLTIEQTADRWLNEIKLRPRTVQFYLYRISAVIRMRPCARLSDVTPDFARKYMAERRRMVGDLTVRSELTVLSSMMSYACENAWEGAPEINPVRLISKKTLAKPATRPRWLRPAQVSALLAACPNKFWLDFLTLLLETGMRRNELLFLRWDEVDFDEGFIQLPEERVKTAEGRLIPLSDTALRTLRGIEKFTDNPHVFSGRKGEVRTSYSHKTWKAIQLRAGVTARIHDIRHTFASWTRQTGLAKDDRQTIMGHSTEEAHSGYSHTDIRTLRELINRHSPSTLLAQVHLTEQARPTQVSESHLETAT